MVFVIFWLTYNCLLMRNHRLDSLHVTVIPAENVFNLKIPIKTQTFSEPNSTITRKDSTAIVVRVKATHATHFKAAIFNRWAHKSNNNNAYNDDFETLCRQTLLEGASAEHLQHCWKSSQLTIYFTIFEYCTHWHTLVMSDWVQERAQNRRQRTTRNPEWVSPWRRCSQLDVFNFTASTFAVWVKVLRENRERKMSVVWT